MKILSLGCNYFISALKESYEICNISFHENADITIKRAIYDINYILKEAPWSPDIIFLGDDSFPITFIGFEELDIPTVWYSVDSHIHPWHLFYSRIFDITFFAQKDFSELKLSSVYENEIFWLPLYCDPLVDKKLNLEKKYDLCFVGTLNPKLNPERVYLIETLKSKIKNFYVKTGPYVEVFNQSKIILNQSVNNDINFRTFQAMGCGSLLLNERIIGNGFKELFEENKDLICYEKNNIDEIVEKVEYYIKNQNKLEKIAESGYNKVNRLHTINNRAQEFLKILKNLDLNKLVEKRKKSKKELDFILKLAYLGAAENYKNIDKKVSEFYVNLSRSLNGF